jgi:predicted HTH domain antitoxin
MELRLTIPDNVAAILQQHWPADDIPRRVLEDLVLQWYQDDMLTEEEVRQALGLETRIQVYELLQQRGVPSKYTTEDFDADIAAPDRRPL